MREILFKAKRVDNGEWIYGYPTLQWHETTGGALHGTVHNELEPPKRADKKKFTLAYYDHIDDWCRQCKNGPHPNNECRECRISDISDEGKIGKPEKFKEKQK